MDAIDKINAILDLRGMSGAELERKIGVSNSVYSQWNTKTTKPSRRSLAKVAEVLSVPIEELLPDKKEKPPSEPGSERIPGYFNLTKENKEKAREYIALLLESQKNS